MAKSSENGPRIGLAKSSTPIDPLHPNFEAGFEEKDDRQNLGSKTTRRPLSKSDNKGENKHSK